jgi:hypothetical protein
MAGYTRQTTFTTGNTIEVADFNNEFNQLLAAFNNSTGHKHNGTAAEGPVIELIGDAGLATPLNKILVDTTNKHLEFYTDVGSAAVQQLRIQDGAIVPILDNDIDLGTTALEFKDGFFDGTVNLDTLVIGTSTGVTSVDTDLTSASSSDDTLASAKAIKTYVDSVPVGDLTAIVAGSGLTGTSLSGPIPTLNVIGGTGITANADDIAIDATVATLTGSQTLTNKTLTTPIISSISNTGTITLPTSTDTLVGKATTDTLTNKTLTSPVLDTAISGTAFKDEDTMSSDSATAVASQQSIKAYVDAAPVGDLTAIVAGTGLTGTDLSGPIPTLNAIGGNGITANADALVIDTTVTVDKTTAQILSSKTLTSPVLNGTLSGTAFLDEDTFSSDSAIAVASQQSIKAYIATQVSEGDLTAIVAGTGLSGTDLTGPIPTLTIDTGTTVDKTTAQILTNKSIDSDNNTITNIVNADIKAAAAIDATKIANGTVTNAEFQYINSLSSNAQSQIDLKAALASPALTGDPTAPTQSASDNSTKLATTAYVDGQVATENELSELNDVTIAAIADANYLIYDDAASVWKNKAISGAFTSTKAGVTTLSASIDATKIADGTVTSAEFQYINTLSSNAQTQIDTKATAGFAVAMAIAL